jgi:hypothetical protein
MSVTGYSHNSRYLELGYILTSTTTIIDYGKLRHRLSNGTEVGKEVSGIRRTVIDITQH